MKKLVISLFFTVIIGTVTNLNASSDQDDDSVRPLSSVSANSTLTDQQEISASTYDDDLKARCLKFAYTHHPHFDGHLSDFHFKFIAALLEQRFVLRMTTDRDNIFSDKRIVITDNGQIINSDSSCRTYPKIEGLKVECVSENGSTFGGSCAHSNCKSSKSECSVAAIYCKNSNHIIRIGESNTVIPLNQDIVKYSNRVIALNNDGNIALGSYNFMSSFIWREGQGTKILSNFTGNSCNRAWCTSNNGEIIGGWTQVSESDKRASVWIDINYNYDLDRLLRKFGSCDPQAILKDYTLDSIHMLSKNGTAMLCDMRKLGAPNKPRHQSPLYIFSILTFW